ncbi:MAG: endonuclease [Acidobacteriota bacterium]|nr:endonuclease [Acidobacteriota bacterium]
MRLWFCLLLLTACFVNAQEPPANLSGEGLRDWIKSEFYDGKHQTLGYATARARMYNFIDNNNDTVVCVYGGLEKQLAQGGNVSNPMPINCEHTVPQSSFGKKSPMKTDIHHLFPTQKDLNSRRSNFPFREIPDNETRFWLIGDNEKLSSIPGQNKDDYSESISGAFEPPEAHKGNTARAVFYFYTMYPKFKISTVGNVELFYAWHLSDPVDAGERTRNDRVEVHQGNRNPFVDHPSWIAPAWNPDLQKVQSILQGMGFETTLKDGKLILGLDDGVDDDSDDGDGGEDTGNGSGENNTGADVPDRRKDKNRLKIMTFNALFLWDGIDPEEGRVRFEWKGNPQKADKRMKNVAKFIKKGDADIVNLVEVENLEALKLMNRKYLDGMGYKAYLTTGTDSYTGQDVALLSRIDPVVMDRHWEEGESGSTRKSVSKNYYATFHMDDLKVAVLGLHFLARPSDVDRRDKRQAQADAVRDRAVMLQNEGYHLVVLGDMNDFDAEVLDRNNNRPISDVMRILKDVDPQNEDDDLLNAARHLDQEKRYTAHWDRDRNNRIDPDSEFSSLDHILLSPELDQKVEAFTIDHTMDPLKVSDHFPVSVHLNLKQEIVITGRVRILSLLPNPAGDERMNESAVIVNETNAPVSMNGWVLHDRAGKTWLLSELGTLEPGSAGIISRNGQPMALNNGGDRVRLIKPGGEVVDTVSYSRAKEGEKIEF